MAENPNLNPCPIVNFIAHSLFWLKLGLVPFFIFASVPVPHICCPSLLKVLPPTPSFKPSQRKRIGGNVYENLVRIPLFHFLRCGGRVRLHVGYVLRLHFSNRFQASRARQAS